MFGANEACMTDRISPTQFHESEGVEDWRVLGDGACAYFRTGSLAAGARLVQAISVLPGGDDHHPDVDVRRDGATVTAEVLPFWRAVLGYEPRRDSPDEDLVDPRSRGASFWFEQMHEARPDGGGAIHVAIWVPYEQAEARIAAALAAGGRMVRDNFAPSWWTLADAAGNEADIATTMGRP